jgi:hypothetical protein
MKQLIQLGILSSVLISSPASAINPVQGFYGGLMAGMSHGPSNNQIAFYEPIDSVSYQLFTGKVSYGIVGAGGGGMLGYKLSHLRLEAELFYNRVSTGPLEIDPGGCTIQNVNIQTPTGVCTPGVYDAFKAKAVGFRGTSSVTFGLINFYYDFFSYDNQAQLVPYIGLGIGQARIQNYNNLVDTKTTYSRGIANHGSLSSSAMQGIFGASYYMDDFTWAGMDLRYTTTKSLPLMDNKSYSLMALMFNINFAFDKGGFDLG